MYTGNQMIDCTLPDWFDGRTEEDDEPNVREYEPEQEIKDNE
jgi:hypothetical protein